MAIVIIAYLKTIAMLLICLGALLLPVLVDGRHWFPGRSKN